MKELIKKWKERYKDAKRAVKAKPHILLMCILIASVMTVGTTLAWFVVSERKVNKLTTPPDQTFRIKVLDIFEEPPTPPGKGDSFAKTVGAVNVGDKRGLVRVMLLPVFESDDGTLLPASFGDQLIFTINESNWLYGGDGYYYYLHILEPGQDTNTLGRNLFTQVTLSEDLGDEYIDATLRIEVKCEAVDLKQDNYRVAWWGSASVPSDTTLQSIDAILAGFVA